ncbi:MAG: hypothetical protein IKA16_00260 [Oscillospiraceae bacterium]|nr:hypothetical protein [Oscillospiraceae bacterium]
MQSKTSFFNKTVFKKNLTRFAPVWGVYILCLVLGVFLLYSNGGTAKQFHFARNMADMVQVMAVVNLGYALIVAQLLFGDLYNSRMCNMLHAFPLRRESWFVTNIVTGLVFSLVPTLVMALVSLPLLAGSIFEGAWTLSWWIFLASNLQFICFFGIAAFSAMCVGNRFTMVAGYGLLNAGAMMAYWLIDTVYTPMLYGVVTPTALAYDLTPFVHMADHPYIQTTASLYNLRELFGEELKGAFATFTITEEWWRLWMLAGVGLVFALLGALLYRKRDLECAGDAVAFKLLVPVFQVLCSVFVAAAGQFFLYSFMGLQEQNFMILTAGLVVGWFIGKMLLERSTRVFQLKNVYGLAALAAVFAVSLWLTHIDILGIETWVPDEDEIKSVQSIYFESDYTVGSKLTEEADIEDMIRFHQGALDFRAENTGIHTLEADGSRVRYTGVDDDLQDKTFVYATQIGLRYELESGKLVRRNYNVWVDSEAGAIAKEYLSRWEHVNWQTITIDGEEQERLAHVMDNFSAVVGDFTDGMKELPAACTDKAKAEELIAAVQRDCAEGNMAQHPYFHTGHFRYEDEYEEDGIAERSAINLTITSRERAWYLEVYADARHTLKWLEDNGLLTWEVSTEHIRMW